MGNFLDTVAFFSYNPGGLFSKDGKGHIAGAGDYSGKKKDSGLPGVTTPAAPTPDASLVKAQTDATDYKRAVILSGGQTTYAGSTSTGGTLTTQDTSKKSLLGA